MGRHGSADVRRPKGRLAATALVLVLVGLLGWRGWVAWSDSGPFVPCAGTWCADSPTVTVTTTPAMEPVLRQVAGETEGACATFRVTAESPETTAQRFEAGGTAAPDIWVPDSTLLARQVATASGGAVTVGSTVASTPVVLAVPDGPAGPRPGHVGLGDRRREHPGARPEHLDRRPDRADGGPVRDRRPARRPARRRPSRGSAACSAGSCPRRPCSPATSAEATPPSSRPPSSRCTAPPSAGSPSRPRPRPRPDARVPHRDNAFRACRCGRGAHRGDDRGCRSVGTARGRLPHTRQPDTDDRGRPTGRGGRRRGHPGPGARPPSRCGRRSPRPPGC